MRLEYFQMVDRVCLLDPAGGVIRSTGRLPEQSPIFEGHFPGHPILPGVLMIETIAQTGGWLVLAASGFDRMAFLAQVKEAKMRAFLAPGQNIETQARLLHEGSGYAVVAGQIESGGKRVADAEILYRIVPFPNADLRTAMLENARRLGVPGAPAT
jgi:3-hydroxyacyl-[acyl-carrier-protein] dehydratase